MIKNLKSNVHINYFQNEIIDNTNVWMEEVNDFDTLIRCFLLRYSEYMLFNLGQYLVYNEAGIDMDNYDLYSDHWVLRNEDGDVLGYARLVTGKRSYFFDEMSQLAKDFKLSHVNANFQYDYYSCSFEGMPEELSSLMRFYHQEMSIMETSRLIIVEKGRVLKNLIQMIETGIAYGLERSDMIISSCLADQVKLYLRYGYEYLSGGESYTIKGSQFSSLYITKDMIVERHQKKLKERGLRALENSLEVYLNSTT